VACPSELIASRRVGDACGDDAFDLGLHVSGEGSAVALVDRDLFDLGKDASEDEEVSSL
jgi:hypothetical protein